MYFFALSHAPPELDLSTPMANPGSHSRLRPPPTPGGGEGSRRPAFVLLGKGENASGDRAAGRAGERQADQDADRAGDGSGQVGGRAAAPSGLPAVRPAGRDRMGTAGAGRRCGGAIVGESCIQYNECNAISAIIKFFVDVSSPVRCTRQPIVYVNSSHAGNIFSNILHITDSGLVNARCRITGKSQTAKDNANKKKDKKTFS